MIGVSIMGLRIYNTLTRKKDVFEPLNPGRVGMYVCGVTVYDLCHIGHARSVVLFDVIYRFLMKCGFAVTYVRNFTDVDDKIINRANQVGDYWKDLAERFIVEFYTDMDALGVLRPTHEPKATEHIGEIQALITNLIHKGFAYEVDGDVMYSVESFSGYGKLSGKKIEDLVSGARVEIDQKKRNPLDFALWKAAKPGEPYWDSPWGPGRPGWHIECSAMSVKYLGERFDIHGGGADLTFPHHENEIAQSEAAAGGAFATYWIHNGFVNIRSEKMSKSLGNVLNIRDILKTCHPETLRLFLLSSHYRSPLDYSDESLKEASSALERLYSAILVLDRLIDAKGLSSDRPEEIMNLSSRFVEAMEDDFNTPRCLAILFEAARCINRINTEYGANVEKIPSSETLLNCRTDIINLSRDVLGILKEEPVAFVERARHAGTTELGITVSEIDGLISERGQARKNRDFKRADEIRDKLAGFGILIEDGPKGATWRVKDRN
jgi:cysteinyl-tRNA synthetase